MDQRSRSLSYLMLMSILAFVPSRAHSEVFLNAGIRNGDEGFWGLEANSHLTDFAIAGYSLFKSGDGNIWSNYTEDIFHQEVFAGIGTDTTPMLKYGLVHERIVGSYPSLGQSVTSDRYAHQASLVMRGPISKRWSFVLQIDLLFPVKTFHLREENKIARYTTEDLEGIKTKISTKKKVLLLGFSFGPLLSLFD